jgi:hypothetical protein
MAEAKLEHRGDNDVEKRQAFKEGSKQEDSKQASKSVGVNEQSWREDEERLLSVAFAGIERQPSRQLEKLIMLGGVRENMN